ncbi:aminoglycoside phosphotransferase family protein [Actinoplanes palleronii]|nr:aminoglycoside phosphotransferase family protein [Actinoplanes palleronii]
MHAGQVDITVETVAALVGSQFPGWRGLPVRPVASGGTVNALFRLGDDVVLRFPLQPSPADAHRQDLLDEQVNAHRLAGRVPAAVPEPLGIGEPGPGYPGPWTAFRWIPGEIADGSTIGDPDVFAADLAAFVTAVHTLDTGGRPWNGETRGGPLADQDDEVRQSLALSAHLTDTARLAEIWRECLDAGDDDRPPVWLHGDLMPGNLLTAGGRLTAVIDLGAMGIGDRAVDLMPAWNLLPAPARSTYRDALGADDATWQRGRGWALVQAIGALPYYAGTNPSMAATARFTLNALIEQV